MDLGISGKSALVCASSKGLGRGCAESLAAEGVNLTLNARGADALEATANHIRDTFGVQVTTVACDVTTAAGQEQVLQAASDIDILVTNAGGPPPGMWSDWTRDDFIAA
ncbi:MAG: SDR family NAD(P)-dependent oxidoreductase, partial [Pseudomonadota bacterium]